MTTVSPAFVTALKYAQERISELVDGLDRPVDDFAQPCSLVLGIARQAGGLYQDVRASSAAGNVTTAVILLRPIVEAAILVRWIETDPQPNTDMYFAEDDRQRLSAAPAIAEFRKRRGLPAADEAIFAPEAEAEMRKTVTTAKAAAVKAGKITGKSNRVMPLINDMAKATGDSAIWEAYEIIYRVVSPWTHFGGRSLAHHEIELRSDGQHLVPKSPYTGAAIRAVAAPTMLVLLGSVSRICDLGFDSEARILQDTIVLWPSQVLAQAAE